MGELGPWGAEDNREAVTAETVRVSGDREGGLGLDQEGGHDSEEAGGGVTVAGFLPAVQELRYVHTSPGTVADHLDYATDAAYAMPESGWRQAHILYIRTIGAAGLHLCRMVEWAFFHRLSRAIPAFFVMLALLWLLNRIPVLELLVPDQWDITSWFPHNSPDTVEIPIESVPVGEG